MTSLATAVGYVCLLDDRTRYRLSNRHQKALFFRVKRAFKMPQEVLGSVHMVQSRTCPSCGERESFTQIATTTLNLGEKTKWRCAACGYRSIRIGSAVDTAEA